MSLSHALALAESVRRRLDSGSHDPANRAATATEIAAGEVERSKAQATLISSLAAVNQTLTALRKATPAGGVGGTVAQKARNPMKLSKAKGTSAFAVRGAFAATAVDPAVNSVMDQMSASGLKPGVSSLKDMANAIQPIITKFDTVLKEPYLKNYNATLNTVPVVGLKGDQIMYIETKPNVTSGAGVGYAWSFFSSLPTGVTIKPTDKVFMFPYKGDFYLSVGKSVWKKAHISENDPAIKSAVDNWPALYVKEWTAIGDSILPATDLSGIVPFAVLSADRQQIAFQLVVLSHDGSLNFLTTDTLGPGAQFETLHYKQAPGAPSTPPKFVKIAYWDGHIVAVDDASNSWNIAPAWDNGTYTISDLVPIDPTVDFTANDAGPVSLRSDGYLWQRFVEAPPPGSSDDATLKWSRWIKADGVTNLGVASPGVLLDMHLLTSTLRSRYIDVQTAVYPVVDRIRAFGLTHSFYLKGVAQDADDWMNGNNPDLAIKNAKSFVAHAQTWSKIVSSSISGAKESVNLMTQQLHDVRVQLEQQLQLLKDKLVGLNATLSVQKDALSKLNAAFWGSIAAMFLGIAVAVAGVVMANPWVIAAGGALFVGGLVATICLAVQMSKLSESIADTESQIRDVNTAIEQLSTIVSSFTDLDNLYGTLNTFWGRMANDASAIKTMDEATAIQIGSEILADKSSIEAAQDMTQQLTEACQTYLDVLNAQGIRLPTSLALFATSRVSRPATPDSLLDDARRSLSKGETYQYARLMKQATLAHTQAVADASLDKTLSGLWFDMPALGSSASVWMQSDRLFTRSVDFPAALRDTADMAVRVIATTADGMDGSLSEVRPHVQQMLTEIIGLGETIQGWTARFPTIPTSSADKAAVEKLRDQAVSTCEGAQNKAALANNQFAVFTNQAREYQQNLDQQIQASQDEQEKQKASANSQLSHLSPPWYVALGGVVAITAWMAAQRSDITSRLNQALDGLNSSIAQFKNLQQSGIVFNGKAQTWIDMTRAVSSNLGGVYNILTGVWGQLLEDPQRYAELMRVEWSQIVDNARQVLQILSLGVASPPVRLTLALASTRGRVLSAASSDKATVMKALSPASTLGPGIRAQAVSAEEVFTKLDILLKSPYLKDIVACWDEGKAERSTLLDVVTSLRTEYVQMAATEYETIQNISSLAILQEYRARNVADGKLSLENFVQFTSQSVRGALSAAQNTSTQFGSAAERFQFVLSVIDQNITDLTKQISGLDSNIETADKQLRDKIIWVIADTIALAFASAAILLAFGVIGPVGAALTVAAQVGATAAGTAAGIKLVLDSLSLADIVQTIESLKALRNTLRASVDQLTAVRPQFSDVVKGVNGLTVTVTDMQAILNNVLNNIDTVGSISFTTEDANAIKDAWARVGQDAQTWMDIINAQGISPITFSVKSKAA